MFNLIEAFNADEANEVEISGQRFPAPSIIEDTEDGTRILITTGEYVVPNIWLDAHASGVAMLLYHVKLGRYFYAPAETFMGGYVETATRMLHLPRHFWMSSDRYLSYAEVVARSRDQSDDEERVELSGSFVHLHAHSEYSALDGLSTIAEMVQQAAEDGQPAIAVTDHGACAGHVELQHVAKAAGIKPIFGIEANFVNDRFLRGDPEIKEGPGNARYVLNDYWHLILWATSDQGLLDLWAASTEANREGFYGRSRMDWGTLRTHGANLMASTACLRGPVSDAVMKGEEDLARQRLAQLRDIFDDRLFVELHTNSMPEQALVNEVLVSLANDYSLPLIVVSDSHYPCAEDKDAHNVWIHAQTNKELISDETGLFEGQHDYHLFTADEARGALHYLPSNVVDEAMHNTVLVAERCNVELKGSTTTPTYSKQGGQERDFERLLDMCLERWSTKIVLKNHPVEEYEDRLATEMDLYRRKGFAGYFLMVADYVKAAKANRKLVGPGRGSGAASLVAYLCDITEIDPVEAELLLARFLNEGRTELPDFDLDFPASARPWLENYVAERWNPESVVRVGTQVRFGNKGIIRKLVATMKTQQEFDFKDINDICALIDEVEQGTAGLGISWEDLWIQHGDVLQPYADKYPDLFRFAGKLVGRLSTYGRHPAGVVISPEGPLVDRLPLRLVGDKVKQLVAELNMDDLTFLNYVKFDLLTLRTLDTLQMCVDLIHDDLGVDIDIYSWRDEYDDPQVWEEICNGRTLGIFQIETVEGTRMTRRFQPRTIKDLADVITLVRPGPMRSGLTNTFFRRKNGEESVSYPDPRMEQILAKRYGVILYQEDIMAACMLLGGYNEVDADIVRKILGKKKVEAVEKQGQRFIPDCVERGMTDGAATELWNQMAEFAKYSFNLAHAFSYAVLGFWCAWFKFHFPRQYIISALSTVDKDRIPEFIGEARRMGYTVLPPDVNESRKGFSGSGTVIRYGLDSVKGVGDKALEAITQGQPYDSWEDFQERKGSAADSGVVATLAAVGAFDRWYPNRRAFEQHLANTASGEYTRCVYKDTSVVKDHGLPCTFDWSTVPVPISVKTNKPLKPKPLPKRCTIRCPQYCPPAETGVPVMDAYTAKEIRDREREVLGVFLSSTPFDFVPPEMLDQYADAEDIDSGDPGQYDALAIVTKVRPYVDRNGKKMAFVDLNLRTGDIPVTVFASSWEKAKQHLVLDALVYVVLNKNQRGITLVDVAKI